MINYSAESKRGIWKLTSNSREEFGNLPSNSPTNFDYQAETTRILSDDGERKREERTKR